MTAAPERGAPGDTNSSPRGYYGLPVLKRAHWGWEIVLYFWVGGVAAGAYAVAAVADFFGDERDRATVRAGRLIAWPLLPLSAALLIKDLGQPRKFLHMLRIVKVKSPMSAGSWGLTAFGAIATLSAALELLALGPRWRTTRRVVGLLGAPFAVFVGGYTGVLLSATAIPLWAGNRVLWGPTFLASAFSTGTAAIEVALALSGAGARPAFARLHRMHRLGLVVEGSLLAAGLLKLGRAGHLLTRGKWGTLFLPGTVGLGLALPLLWRQGTSRAHTRAHDAGVDCDGITGAERAGTAFTSACILLGGLIFRACLIYAGRDSADDASAYFALTAGKRTKAGS